MCPYSSVWDTLTRVIKNLYRWTYLYLIRTAKLVEVQEENSVVTGCHGYRPDLAPGGWNHGIMAFWHLIMRSWQHVIMTPWPHGLMSPWGCWFRCRDAGDRLPLGVAASIVGDGQPMGRSVSLHTAAPTHGHSSWPTTPQPQQNYHKVQKGWVFLTISSAKKSHETQVTRNQLLRVLNKRNI